MFFSEIWGGKNFWPSWPVHGGPPNLTHGPFGLAIYIGNTTQPHRKAPKQGGGEKEKIGRGGGSFGGGEKGGRRKRGKKKKQVEYTPPPPQGA